jgi:hypothetical protein
MRSSIAVERRVHNRAIVRYDMVVDRGIQLLLTPSAINFGHERIDRGASLMGNALKCFPHRASEADAGSTSDYRNAVPRYSSHTVPLWNVQTSFSRQGRNSRPGPGGNSFGLLCFRNQ